MILVEENPHRASYSFFTATAMDREQGYVDHFVIWFAYDVRSSRFTIIDKRKKKNAKMTTIKVGGRLLCRLSRTHSTEIDTNSARPMNIRRGTQKLSELGKLYLI